MNPEPRGPLIPTRRRQRAGVGASSVAVFAVLAVLTVLALSSCDGPRTGSTSPGQADSRPASPGPASPGPTSPGPADPGPTSPRPDGLGPAGHVGPISRPCHGVAVSVADDIRRVLDAHPPGTTYCLAAGTHRLERPLVPERGDALIGRRGAVLSGSKVLTGWRPDGGVWTTTGFLPPAPGTNGECVVSEPTCTTSQDVFLDDRRLDRVGSRGAVTPGTFHTDYSTNIIAIGDDPRSHLVEQAVAPGLVRSTVDDVTVANLVLEQAANEAQSGAVENRRVTPHAAGSGWRILDNEVRLNHGVGIGFANASTVTGNDVHHQGQLGLGAWGVGSLVSDNEIAFNGVAGYSPEWEAGGVKSWMTERLTLTRNFVHDNRGPGLWSDGGTMDTTYEHNRIEDNWGAGIQHEISYDATIRHNEIAGNGRRHKGWAWDAGIQIQSSGGTTRIEVSHNVVTGNANGITLIDSGHRAGERPAPHGLHVVRNVWVHDNTVTMFPGQVTGAVQDTGDPAIFTNDNRFDANTYHLPSMTGRHFAWADADVGWLRWRVLGNDIDGQVEPMSR
ncbi:MAG: right-handed parallel beta-helix repeat-containing protein [Nocardioidaceae bacterium]